MGAHGALIHIEAAAYAMRGQDPGRQLMSGAGEAKRPLQAPRWPFYRPGIAGGPRSHRYGSASALGAMARTACGSAKADPYLTKRLARHGVLQLAK